MRKSWHTRAADIIEEIEKIIPLLKDEVAYDRIVNLPKRAKTLETLTKRLQDIDYLREESTQKWKSCPKGEEKLGCLCVECQYLWREEDEDTP